MTLRLERASNGDRQQAPRGRSRWLERIGLLAGALACLVVVAADARTLLDLGGVRVGALYELALAMLAAVALIMVVEALIADGRPSELALTGIGVALLAQVLWRPTPEARGWLHLAVGWAAFFVAYRASSRRLRVGGLLVVLLAILVMGEALYAIAQGQGSYPTLAGDVEPSGTLFNPNHLAGLLNLGLALALAGPLHALLQSSKPRPWSERIGLAWVLLLTCGVPALALVFTRSRGGWIACAVALTFGVVLLIAGGRDAYLRRTGVAAAVVLVIAAGVGLYRFGPDRVMGRFARPDDPSSRWQQYRDTVSLIAERPLLGVGPGMYVWHFRRHQTDTPRSLYQHAHNDYLESAAELGVPLAAAWWAFVLFVLARDVRAFASSRRRGRRALAFGCAVAIVSMLVHSLVDFNLQLPSHLTMFAAILGVGAAVGNRRGLRAESSDTKIAPWLSIAASVVAIALVAGAAWRVNTRLEAENLLRRELDLAHIEQAARVDDGNAEAHFRLGLAFRDGLERNDSDRARRELERAVELNPYRWYYQLELAWLHELQGRSADAERALLEAVRLNPNAAEYRWRLANFYVRQGDLGRAVPEITRAVQADPKLGPIALSLVLKSAGDEASLAATWPDDPASGVGLLRLLCDPSLTKASPPMLPDLAKAKSFDVLRDASSLSVADASVAVGCVLRSGDLGAARAAWIDLMNARGIEDRVFQENVNLIWNGGFELPIGAGIFDWRRPARGGSFVREISLDDDADGKALALGAGVGNAGKRPFLEEVVAVEPGSSYEIGLRLQGRSEKPDDGAVLTVNSAAGKELGAVKRGVLDPRGWNVREVLFEVPAGPPWVRVRLHAPVTTFDRDSMVVVDDVQLRSAGSSAAPE